MFKCSGMVYIMKKSLETDLAECGQPDSVDGMPGTILCFSLPVADITFLVHYFWFVFCSQNQFKSSLNYHVLAWVALDCICWQFSVQTTSRRKNYDFQIFNISHSFFISAFSNFIDQCHEMEDHVQKWEKKIDKAITFSRDCDKEFSSFDKLSTLSSDLGKQFKYFSTL